jgi:predicted lipoprotein with Yx(FWY)xxD motif
MRARIALLGVALLGGLAACANPGTATTGAPKAEPAVGVKIGQSSLGPILTDLTGRTLYAFVDDHGGNSTCTGVCLASWPALTSDKDFTAGAGADTRLLAGTKRTDGVEQAEYGSWPLYYYAGDQGPGDIDGQNVDGTWFVVGADGKLVRKTP